MSFSSIGLVWADRQKVVWAAKSSYCGWTRTASRACVAFASSEFERRSLSATGGGRFPDLRRSRCRSDRSILLGRENDLAAVFSAGGRSTGGRLYLRTAVKVEPVHPSHRVFALMLFAALAIVSVAALSRPVSASAAPTAAADEERATEDATLTVLVPGVLGNDGVGFAGSLVASLACGPAHGSVCLGADGSFCYSPDADFNGIDQFTYRAGDGIQWSEPATVTIAVAPVPEPTRVIPRPRVGTPAAPLVMYAYRRATVTARLTPKHRAGSSIRIYRYRRTSTGWKASGYVKATSSDGTHYRGAVSFPRAGRWRLRAYAVADGGHASAWSAGSDYVRVKSRGQLAVAMARRYLGRPYSSGGQGPRAFCCSGLTRRVYASIGISLPDTASRQYSRGPRVSTRALRPGDLVFFYSPVSHVGIYIGGGMMIDANHPGGSVGIRRLYPGLVGATRPWA